MTKKERERERAIQFDVRKRGERERRASRTRRNMGRRGWVGRRGSPVRKLNERKEGGERNTMIKEEARDISGEARELPEEKEHVARPG